MCNYIKFGVSISVISWLVGMAFNAFLRKTNFYQNKLTHLNFIKNKKVNKLIGIPAFKWIVKNTFFKFFNQKLKLRSKTTTADLTYLRNEMTNSEIDHLVGFVFVTTFALFYFYKGKYLFCLIIMVINTRMNLYPSLLQQENKRRIDAFLKKLPV